MELSQGLPEVTAHVAAARRQSIDELLRRSARKFADKQALIQGQTTYTYGELDLAVSRVAASLRERGVMPNERVALYSRNSIDYAVSVFAIARAGAVSVPLNFNLGPDEVAYILEHAECSAILAEEQLVPVAIEAMKRADLVDDITLTVAFGDVPPRVDGTWVSFRDLADSAAAGLDDAVTSDVAFLMYTSGTESRPKGAVMTTGALLAQYVSMVVYGEMSSNDRELHVMPLYHAGQLHCFLLPDVYLGATNVLMDGTAPADIMQCVQEHRITKLWLPPTVWISMLRHPDFLRYDLSSIELAYYGASAMPVQVLRELLEVLPNARFFNCYGQTELGGVTTMLGPDDQFRKSGSCGLPTLHEETGIVDADGRHLGVGEVGEIVHRNPQATLGYWRDPERTEAVFRGGWFHSGDLGYLDSEGYLYLVDRVKDMIKTGGENVASREVEEVIFAHPAVAEAAVVGVADPRWIESVTAVVVTRPGFHLEAAELIDFCRSRLAGFKTPKAVYFVGELPKNASGKILKRELRDRYSGAPQ
ncbi:fatty acyl-CoA synthetase [Pseudonocardia oroxyli]|nr:fatty acyl-CoA synthetase [Pseudonocardia oroxyli]